MISKYFCDPLKYFSLCLGLLNYFLVTPNFPFIKEDELRSYALATVQLTSHIQTIYHSESFLFNFVATYFSHSNLSPNARSPLCGGRDLMDCTLVDIFSHVQSMKEEHRSTFFTLLFSVLSPLSLALFGYLLHPYYTFQLVCSFHPFFY